MWRLNPSLPMEKLGVGSSLSVVRLHAGFMVRLCCSLPYPFSLGIFSFTQCVGVAGLGSRSRSLVITSCVTVCSVCWWVEGSSGTSIWVDLPLKASCRLSTLVPWGRYVKKTCGDCACNVQRHYMDLWKRLKTNYFLYIIRMPVSFIKVRHHSK